MNNLSELTNEELKLKLQELKEIGSRKYSEYGSKISMICETMGKYLDTKYKPKWSYEDGKLYLFVDGYGSYHLVRYEGTIVLSNENYRSGIWEQEIDALYNRAKQLNATQEEEQEREALLEKINKFTPLEESS